MHTILPEDSEKAEEILDILAAFFDLDLPDGDDDVLSVLVRSILSQATSTTNRNQAFASLLDAFEGDWNQVRQADQINVENAIKVGGLANQKSIRIQNILESIFLEFGECSLEGLKKNTAEENFDYLCSFPGVGPQSAALTIMLSGKADICPVNTDVLRVLKRLELLAHGASGKAAHKRVNALFPKTRLKEAHYALITLGRTQCSGREPDCAACPLDSACEYRM